MDRLWNRFNYENFYAFSASDENWGLLRKKKYIHFNSFFAKKWMNNSLFSIPFTFKLFSTILETKCNLSRDISCYFRCFVITFTLFQSQMNERNKSFRKPFHLARKKKFKRQEKKQYVSKTFRVQYRRRTERRRRGEKKLTKL